MFARARYKSKREVEVLVADLNPRPDVPPAVRKLPTPAVVKTPTPATGEQQRAANGAAPASVVPQKRFLEKRPVEVKLLAPERYKIQFTVSHETYEKLRRAQDLLRHSVPDGDPAIIFERALALLVTELERTKIGATGRPRAARHANAASRHIPAAVRRAVWQRDGGQCAFTGPHWRCAETAFWNTTTWCRSRRAAKRQRGTSSFVVAPTINTRPIGILDRRERRCYENDVPCSERDANSFRHYFVTSRQIRRISL